MAITEQEWFSRTAKYINKTCRTIDCDFCGDFLCQRYSDKQTALLHDDINLKAKYTVALIATKYRNGEKAGTFTQSGYKLRYCPVCGKKISR